RAFRFSIVQQPIRARMCGSSDKDWRPVSPPPVLKLELLDMEGNSVIDGTFMQYLVVHTTLWKEDREEELTVIENNLLGEYSASSSIVEDENGERGCFFVFPNLSIRLEGRYRLRFMLIKL
ncbi:velvet factor, partial [Coemansia spiralis]